MKIFISFFCLICIAMFSSAQENFENKTITEPVFNLNAGTIFSGGTLFSGNSFFIKPSFVKPLTSKFSLQAGTVFQTVTLFSAPNSENLNFKPSAFMSFYGLGAYKLNYRTTIYGGFMQTRSVFSNISESSKYSANSFFGGADFKLSNNSTLGFRIAYRADNNPFLMFPSSTQSCFMPIFPRTKGFPFGF